MSDQVVSILMAGAFPPPVHGMAAVNAAVRDRLRAVGVEPLVIDLAASSLDRGLLARLGRLPKVVRGLVRLGSARALRGDTLYMSVSGGLGQAYEILILALARLRGMRVFLHHHSFAYLEEPRWLTRQLVRLAGLNTIHITQSPGMAERLVANYKGVHRVVPVSNVVFFLQPEARASNTRRYLETIGFLSNLSEEKGVFEFFDLIEALEAAGFPIKAKLAGPFQDAKTETRIRSRLSRLHSIEYVGPKYGAEKEAFWSSIDAFVFPTHYDNETEGLVNLEAMSHAIPVIAYGRGAIPEIIIPQCGRVVPPDEPFAPAALAQIEIWLRELTTFQAASAAAARQFMTLRTTNAARWQTLLTQLLEPKTCSRSSLQDA